MQEALRVIREEGKSVYSVAKDFNLVRNTLNNRVLERHEDQPGRPTKLSSEDEKALVNNSIYMTEKAFPLTAGEPLDVTVFSTLKARWARTLETLQAVDIKFQAKKRNFLAIFSTVQDCSTTEKDDSTAACCVTCGHATVNANSETLVPKRLQGILRPLENTTTPQTKRKKLTACVWTHQDIIDELKKKEEDEKLKKANDEEKKKKAMLNRMQKEADEIQRRGKAGESKLQPHAHRDQSRCSEAQGEKRAKDAGGDSRAK
ncbi:Hypp8461 [Branchiostoma lanceolatum]|uniref:Hypp8461 protein n=1 Tax=Branchiostoma lanceolatum TaxID=7740 RepID=A0A8J9Z7Q3_BRALA|nr:Hypp8461 [Branchiostoma lanceolatum]